MQLKEEAARDGALFLTMDFVTNIFSRVVAEVRP